MTESFLSSFDCVIYDLFDAGNDITLTNDKDIESYIKKGGSILVTHDRWDKDVGPLYLLVFLSFLSILLSIKEDK